ncbi:metal ABC transporter solute-binding protein, Zn/Mn family [Sulfurovum sp. TSL1]|uniref:metal ABC transporter solute-binding protein, Zn/Mn family n=1 Tax=Sulfurovum sp. TSL1 TaxID=2826994 RepID=UPI001CC52459|nr:zinc ABC transporter substrate-binding protein [Sulfurovum sp. TSL1]GIT97670.1 cation ABC transporter substrate-binding protein [Sulfurovum sp. TSL1]
MKKITLIFLVSTTYIFSNINAVVSILPEQTFVKAIGGDKVNISLMVQPGNSPHTYEPKPSQMVEIAKAQLYFAIDVEFEQVWLSKFKSLNPEMQIIDLAEGITKIEMTEAHEENGHEEESDTDHSEHKHEGKDPHIWTAPANVKIIAKNIYNALKKEDPENSDYYKKNLDIFLTEIDKIDREIIDILSSLKDGKKFMVFHPSWGYFAQAYHLEQIAVEVEGKEPKPKELIHLLEEAKEEKVKAIFTQPEFSDTVAKIIAKELQIPVVKVSPLAANWSENLINIAKAIAGKH